MVIPEKRLTELFNNFNGKAVAIIGDVMLDRYIWGTVARISPEAPVPVVDVNEETEHPGGASNVALNVRNLGAVPYLFGVIGNDGHAEVLKNIFKNADIPDEFLVRDDSRPTTVKTRVIAHSQHVVRIDYEKRQTISENVQHDIIQRFEQKISTFDAVVMQDYNKGVLHGELIKRIVSITRRHGVPICVDPKFQNFFEYKDVTVFKPNRNETENALGVHLQSEEDYYTSAKKLMERLQCENVLLTLGEKGMLLLESNATATRVPTRARKVADVSGAGDTVISALAVLIASGATILESASVANIAGGLVCEEIGIVPVEKDSLFQATLHFNNVSS